MLPFVFAKPRSIESLFALYTRIAKEDSPLNHGRDAIPTASSTVGRMSVLRTCCATTFVLYICPGSFTINGTCVVESYRKMHACFRVCSPTWLSQEKGSTTAQS